MILSLFSLGIYFLSEIPEVKMLMLGFTVEDSSSLDLNSLSSSRLDIYAHEYNRFLDHPLFGNGMVFNNETSVSGAHNLVIELLVQSGIVGLLLYVVPLLIVLRHAAKNMDQEGMSGWLLFLIAILLHGMVEVNFFNYSTDLLFWTACGIVMSCKKTKSDVSRTLNHYSY